MKPMELAALMDREAATLENDHKADAASLMKAGAETIRALVAGSAPEVTAGIRVVEFGDLPRLKQEFDKLRITPGPDFLLAR